MRVATLGLPVLLVLVAACDVDAPPGAADVVALPADSPIAQPAASPDGAGRSGVKLALRPYPARPRGACLRVKGWVYSGETVIESGEPKVLDDSENCVEGGHPGADKHVVYTDKDNPLVWTKTTLQRFDLPTGERVAQDYTRDGAGYRVGYGDLDMGVSGGDRSVNGQDLFTAETSLAAPLFPWTAAAGTWAAPKTFVPVSPGLRLGRTPEDLQLLAKGPTGGDAIAAFPATVALDPNVLLVPVQAVLFYGDGQDALAQSFAPSQLALWDRVPTEGARSVFSAPGGITGTSQLLSNVLSDFGPTGSHGQTLPDDIWAPCGVQFRLVNVIPMRVPTALLAPRGHIDLVGPVVEFWNAISADARFQSNRLTVVFAPHCADVDGGNGVLPPGGQSLLAQHFSCVKAGASSSTLAHELGHVIMAEKNHTLDTGTTVGNLMSEAPGASTGLDVYAQCRAARNHLSTVKLLMK